MLQKASKTPGWMVSIIIYLGDAEELRVWSLESMFNGVKHRMTFSRSNEISDIFEPDLADQFSAICDRLLHGDSSFLVMPDVELSLGPMKLVGLRAMRTEARDGRKQLNLRFKYFVGTMADMMRIRIPFDHHILDHREKIAVEALADITAPLLGIASIQETSTLSDSQSDVLEAKLRRINDRASDLQFYLSMLVRYVRECTETIASIKHEPDQGQIGSRQSPMNDEAEPPGRVGQDSVPESQVG